MPDTSRTFTSRRRRRALLQRYGAYVIDGGGASAPIIRCDQDVDATDMRRDSERIKHLMRRTTNNDYARFVTTTRTVGGGPPVVPEAINTALLD